MVWDYYDKVGTVVRKKNIGGQAYEDIPATGVTAKDALANELCTYNHWYYYSWLMVGIFLTVLRTISLVYMFKGSRYLHKRDLEKAKRK